MKEELKALCQSLSAKRALIEEYANEFMRSEREGFQNIKYLASSTPALFLLNESFIKTAVFFLQELEDLYLPDNIRFISGMYNVNVAFVALFLWGINASLPRLCHVVFQACGVSLESLYPEIEDALVIARDVNSSLSRIGQKYQAIQEYVRENQSAVSQLNRNKPTIFSIVFVCAVVKLFMAYLNKNIHALAISTVVILSTLPVLIDILSFKQFKKHTAQLEREFQDYLNDIIGGIEEIKCGRREPAGVYSTFFEISYQAGPKNMVRMSDGNVNICVRFKDVMKALLHCLSKESGINLIKYDLEGISIKLKNHARFQSGRDVRDALLKLLQQKSVHLHLRKMILPSLQELTSSLSLKWQVIEVERDDNKSELRIIVSIADLNSSTKQQLLTELHRIFTSARVREEHDEIIVFPALTDIHGGFRSKYRSQSFVQEQSASHSVQALVSQVDEEGELAITNQPGTVTVKRKHRTDVMAESASVSIRAIGLHLRWKDDLPTFDSRIAEEGPVFRMYSSHTKPNRFFFFVDNRLTCDTDTVDKMKRGVFIGEKGQGFKRCGVRYKTCGGFWAEAYLKYKQPRKDGRVYLRVADDVTYPQHTLFIADGYDPHPHKK